VRSLIQASKFGEPLCQAFQLDLFKADADEWCKRMNSSAKIKAQFERLFADSIAKEAKAKRKLHKRKGQKDLEETHVINHTSQQPAKAPTVQQSAHSQPLLEPAALSVPEDHAVERGDCDRQDTVVKVKRKKRKLLDENDAVHAGSVHCATATEDEKEGSAVKETKTKKIRKQKHAKVCGDNDVARSGNKHMHSEEQGDETGAVSKHKADAKSLVDEVMAELAIGSFGGDKVKRKNSSSTHIDNSNKGNRNGSVLGAVKRSEAESGVKSSLKGNREGKVKKRGRIEA
jgi:hypothetical protein